MKLKVCTVVNATTETEIDVPFDSWDDVISWYVKWDTLHYTLNGTKWEELELHSPTDDIEDWRDPREVEISDPATGRLFGTMY